MEYRFLITGKSYMSESFSGHMIASSVSEAREKMENTRTILQWEFVRDEVGKVKTEEGEVFLDPLY